jgi:hypothetical protein
MRRFWEDCGVGYKGADALYITQRYSLYKKVQMETRQTGICKT